VLEFSGLAVDGLTAKWILTNANEEISKQLVIYEAQLRRYINSVEMRRGEEKTHLCQG
jgi:hypothetical protein